MLGLGLSIPQIEVRRIRGGVPVPTEWAVLSSNGTSYCVPFTVLDSDGTSYAMPLAVLSSDGTSYNPVVCGVIVGNFLLLENGSFILLESGDKIELE